VGKYDALLGTCECDEKTCRRLGFIVCKTPLRAVVKADKDHGVTF
jgi:hypothetical protein